MLFLFLACTGEPTDTAPAADDTSPATTDDTAPVGETAEPVDLSGVPDGLWLVTFSIATVGNLEVPFQLELTPGEVDGSRGWSSIVMRASDGETVSDPLTTITDVSLADDDSFTMDFGSFFLPAAYSPTSSEIEIQAAITGSLSDDGFCGQVSGSVVTFEIDLEGSTFGGNAWDDRKEGYDVACPGEGGDDGLERLAAEDCPTVAVGSNTGFVSGEVERSFELLLPDDYDPKLSYPLLFVFHGLGGSAAEFLDSNGIGEQAPAAGFLTVAPQASKLGGSVAYDSVSPAENNVDVTFFDDLRTCVSDQLPVDPDRIHVTGMSNGGLMTGAIIASRSAQLASAAPLSGGISLDFADDHEPIPVLVTWGGKDDYGSDTDFHLLAGEMLEALSARDHFLAACNHGDGHEVNAEYWPWVLQFLNDHPEGAEDPSPYALGLPEMFPDYCSLYEG